MTLAEYYEILGLPAHSSVEDIKKAYRNKARLYHPDINSSPNAKEMFIGITEAYEFLLDNHEKIRSDDKAYQQAMEEWRKYRQYRSGKSATSYAQTSYNTFKKTNLYRTTRIFDGTTIILSFVIAILVLVYAVYGYIYRLRNPIPGLDKPSVLTFVLLLLPGIIFFIVSFIFLRAFTGTAKKRKKKF
jgi:hypothetical protein